MTARVDGDADSAVATGDERSAALASSVRRKLAAAVGSAVLVLVVALAGAIGVMLLLRSAERIEDSHGVRAEIDRLSVHLVDAETGQRGYLITGDTAYLAPYTAAIQQIGRDTTALASRVRGDSARSVRYTQLMSAVNVKLAELSRTIALRRDSGFAVAQQVVRTNVGKRSMDVIRGVMREIEYWEVRQRDALARERARRARFVLTTISIGSVLAVLLVVLVGRQLKRDVVALTTAETELQRRAALLEEQATELATQVEHAQTAAEEAEEASNEAIEARLEAERAMLVAEEANGAKSEFLATMSHELRTPLNAIIGYASLLAGGVSGPLAPDQERQLSRIRSSADHLLGLIDEVLTLSRFDANRETTAPEPLDLEMIVDDAVVIAEPLASQKGLEFAVTAPNERVVIETDRGKLRQALVNLLSNAIKFTDQGRVSFSARIDGDRVTFEVADTGIGIDAQHLERIFEPFWQVDRRTTRRVGGTGLGLAVTRRIASLLGGSIAVQSTLGQGSRFTLSVPLRPTTAA